MTTPPPPLPGTPAPSAPQAPDRRPLIIGAVALTVVLMGAAAGAAHWLRTPSVGDPLAVSPEPLAFGLFSPEGSTDPKQEAIARALEEINAVGGVLGHEVAAPTASDDAGTLLDTDPDVVLGSHAMGSEQLLPEVLDAGTLYCGNAEPYTATPGFGEGRYFSTIPGQDQVVRALTQVIAEDGREKIAVAYTPGSEVWLDTITAEARTHGIEVVGVDILRALVDPSSFQGAGTDAAKLLEEGVDAVIPLELTAETVTDALMHQGLPAEGVYVPGLPLVANPTVPLDSLGPAGATVVRHHTGGERFPEIDWGSSESGDMSYSAQFGGVTAALYDCVNLVALAAEAAGSVEPAEIAAHLPAVSAGGRECTGYADCLARVRDGQDIAYVGPRGPLTWDDGNRLVEVPFEVVRLHGEGEPVDTEVRTFSLGS
ncbi:ABC transporter substrate-binding protein [Nocardiopsis sp. CC223A]|uniref:ABC transporter substrate-binding protein n=1 Tax=Nocardiopsis sp. CC223A TaxID=3044051 RepID=UPI00278BB6D0|nr:ABC transporter substrate-binding protein [Nocardiopsis sp. CC223A]